MKKLLIFLFLSLYSFQSISDELGVISLMYHRVGEGKYPSTNVSVEMFQQHLNAIEESGLKFIEPLKFKEQIIPGKSITILIGPEGDFSNEEIKSALENNYKAVALGDSRLRTETAGIVACHTIKLCNE